MSSKPIPADLLQEFFKQSPDLLAIAGTDGHFHTMNPRWEKVLGYTIEELCSRPFLELVHPEDVASTGEEAAKLISGGYVTILFQNRYRHKNGTHRWLLWTAFEHQGNLLCSARDITEFKETISFFEAVQSTSQTGG